ncbi:AAA family ATPase, partial [Scytonema sp. NUACC21]
EWITLREWMNANRQFRVWQERLKVAMLEWKNNDYDSGALLRGVPLSVAEDWLYKRSDEMTLWERDFIQASASQRDREKLERDRRRQLLIVSNLVSYLVAIIVLGAALLKVSLGFELLLFLAAVTIAALFVTISQWRLPFVSSYRDEQLVIQDIRELESCINAEAIRNFHRRLAIDELQSPTRPLLRIFFNISENVEAALNQESAYYQRQSLEGVIQRLDAQLHTLARSTNKYAARFYVIGQHWREVLNNYLSELAETVEIRQEIDNPYIIGIPLNDTQREIFIGRTNIGLRIEQLLLDQRRSPLLLYGQRRMGKTSLLNNLERLLPNNIIPMFIDLQGAPSLAKDFAGFLYNLAKEMVKSAKKQGIILSPLTREALKDDPFTCFNEWLSEEVEQVLEKNIALLMLDEFEALDSAITKGRFDEQDVLGMLRHIIQHHPQFKVLLSGSHTLEEYQRWASYLINVQVVHISYFKQEETCQLIERPIKDFALRYKPDAVERVLQLTRCHPYLVQLLCNEIVILKNEQDPSIRRFARLSDVEAAIPKALNSGSLFFADIQKNQVDSLGLSILRFLADQGEGVTLSTRTLSQQFPNNVNSALKLLLQRELIEKLDDGYRFQVELIRRWFAQ